MLILFQDQNTDNNVVTGGFSKLWDKLEGWVQDFILKLPNLLLAIVLFIIFWILGKYVSKLFTNVIMKHVKQQSIKVMVGKLVFAVTVLIGFFFALGVLDLDKVLTSVLAGAGVVALAIGLALQGTLNNTFSGVILSFLPRIQLGDWVETNGFAGFVEDINLRSIIVRENDNNLVMIPNASIIENPFKNFSQTPRSRIFVNCGVGYESDLEKVKQVTIDAVKNIFPQEGNEAIELFYTEFGDSSINYVLRFWTPALKQKDISEARNMAIMAIKKAYDAEDINIPFRMPPLYFHSQSK